MTSDKIRLGATAMGISFLGTLPLGILNISVSSLTMHHNTKGALAFSLAAAAVEVLTVRLALTIADRIPILQNYQWLFRLTSAIVLVLFSAAAFTAASKSVQFTTTIPQIYQKPILAGIMLSILNPFHIPFWMGWAAVLKSRGILSTQKRDYDLFVISIGMGTLAAFGTYGLAGRLLIEFLEHWQREVNWILGIMLIIAAGTQLFKTSTPSSKIKREKSLTI